MFLQPTLAGEDAYFDDDDEDDDDDNDDPSYVQNESQKAPGTPDTFYFVQPHTSPSQPQAQMQSPAQAYAQSYVQTLNHSHDNGGRPPLASDSSQTPPSPISKQRRSIQRPSLSNHNSLKRTSNAHTGHNSNQHTSAHANVKDSKNANKTSSNDKRTQSLNALPQKTLIHLLQIKEEERKRAKNLLRSALSQLEVEVEKGDLMGAKVRELEERVERVQREKGGEMGVDALKEMLAEQKGRVSGGAEVEGLKLKLSNTETELRRVKEEYRALKVERDDSDRALVRARALAREMKEKAILIQAREQGRQEGFEEGLKQGRLLGGEGSTGDASGSGRMRSRRSRERSTNPKGSSRRNANPVTAEVGPSQASLEAEAAIRSIAERENERVRLQLKDVERELDMERQRLRDVEREKVRSENMAREEREKRDEREKEKEREREKERVKERAKEREREASQAKEREKERDMRDALRKQVDERGRLQRAKERLELEKDKIREQMEKEKQDVEKKLAEARKDKEKFEKLLKEEKEKAVPLPYVPMAPPPRPSSSAARVSEVPRTSSAGSRPHRSSIDSGTSQASTIHFDMLQLPNGERGSGLSVIHEDVSAGRTSPSVNSASGSTSAPPPTWFTNPPIDYGKNNGNSTPNGSYPHHQNQADYLSPPDNNAPSLRRSTASSSSYEFIIVPPSRPPSVVGGGDPKSNNSHNARNTHHSNPEDPQFLSPNQRPIQLPQSQPQTRAESPAARPTLPRYGDTSRVSTRPNSPAGFMGAVDVNGGGFPPGFVPQTLTDTRGRSTPIMVGGGFIPPSPSGGGGLERSGTPAPIYGNPIARERDKKREEAESAATPPQSPRSHSPLGGGGGDWSGPLAGLHPPIFPVTGHQQPFQHPPPGSWVGGSSTPTTDRLRNEHSPVLSTRPFVPGQTSTAGSGGGTKPNHHSGGFGGGLMTPGPRNQDFSSPVIPSQPLASGGAWGAPRRPPSGFGGGAGSTPGPRSQDLPPVIPNLTAGGGGWSRPPSSFGGGMTPGPRDQDLPPVIPNPTVGSGGWGTPSRPSGSFGGGMTPGTRSQDLPPVIPNSTMSGGWSTSSRPPVSFGGSGGGTTPGPRNQDLPPVIPNPTAGGGGWSTPNRPTSGFGGGGMTPGPRSQELPPVIPNSTMSGGWSTPNRPPVSFGGGGMTPGPRSQDLPPVIPNSTVGGGWSTGPGSFAGGTGSTPGPRSQGLPPVIPNATMGGGWSSPNPPPHSLGAGGMTPGPRSQDLPPVIPNSTMGGGWTPNRASGGFGAGSTPGPTNQDLPSVGGGGSGSPFQPNFSIYGPPTNGSRSSSPYPNGEGVGEDEDTDPITALNTKMNAANLGTDVGPSTGAGGAGRGGKSGKKGKKKR